MHKKIDTLIICIGKKLKALNLSLVTAESCTGGGVAYFFSKQPSCSSILERGYVAYSNPSKETLLNVKSETLQLYGPVSKETAKEMAKGALKNSQAQVSIAITGIAGPDRDPNKKAQAGVVWISCIDTFGHELTKKKQIKGSRKEFIDQVILNALVILKEYLAKNKNPNSNT